MTDKLTQAIALIDDVASGIAATDTYQRGRMAERTMIVAWLREQGCKGVNDIDTADCIETGEHLTCI